MIEMGLALQVSRKSLHWRPGAGSRWCRGWTRWDAPWTREGARGRGARLGGGPRARLAAPAHVGGARGGQRAGGAGRVSCPSSGKSSGVLAPAPRARERGGGAARRTPSSPADARPSRARRSFDLRIYGGDVSALPGLESWLYGLVTDSVLPTPSSLYPPRALRPAPRPPRPAAGPSAGPRAFGRGASWRWTCLRRSTCPVWTCCLRRTPTCASSCARASSTRPRWWSTARRRGGASAASASCCPCTTPRRRCSPRCSWTTTPSARWGLLY
jgi:hypothetical protein